MIKPIHILGKTYKCIKSYGTQSIIRANGTNVYIDDCLQYIEIGDEIDGMFINDIVIDNKQMNIKCYNPHIKNYEIHNTTILSENYLNIKKRKMIIKDVLNG